MILAEILGLNSCVRNFLRSDQTLGCYNGHTHSHSLSQKRKSFSLFLCQRISLTLLAHPNNDSKRMFSNDEWVWNNTADHVPPRLTGRTVHPRTRELYDSFVTSPRLSRGSPSPLSGSRSGQYVKTPSAEHIIIIITGLLQEPTKTEPASLWVR